MAKILRKTRRRDSEQATRVKKTAIIVGCSPRQVRRVIEGEQMGKKGESILKTYMFLSEGEKNLFIQAVEKLVPVN